VLYWIEIDNIWKSTVTTSSYPCYDTVERAAGNFKRTAAKPTWAHSNFRKDTTEWYRPVHYKEEQNRRKSTCDSTQIYDSESLKLCWHYLPV